MLEHYEQISSGSADRIIRIVEDQSSHIQDLERMKLASDIQSEKAGKRFGFIITLVVLVGALMLVALDKPLGGLTAIIGTLVALVSPFVFGRRSRVNEEQR
jgi:uncharacterized membrane protein